MAGDSACVHKRSRRSIFVITQASADGNSELPGGGTFLPKPYGFNALVAVIGGKLGGSP